MKDPNAPRKHKSAYIYFSEAYMEVVKHEKPELKPNDIFRELGYRWKQLTDSEKKVKC